MVVNNIWRNARFGLRLLKRSPGSSAIAVVALAIGIGANTAIFSTICAPAIFRHQALKRKFKRP